MRSKEMQGQLGLGGPARTGGFFSDRNAERPGYRIEKSGCNAGYDHGTNSTCITIIQQCM